MDKIRPQCILCLEVFAHSSLKKTKLQWHLETKYEKISQQKL